MWSLSTRAKTRQEKYRFVTVSRDDGKKKRRVFFRPVCKRDVWTGPGDPRRPGLIFAPGRCRKGEERRKNDNETN